MKAEMLKITLNVCYFKARKGNFAMMSLSSIFMKAEGRTGVTR